MKPFKISRSVSNLAIMLMTLVSAVGFWQIELRIGSGLALSIGLIWLGLQQLSSSWPGSLGLTLSFLLSGAASFWGVNPLWLILNIFFALIAWDLGHFVNRLRNIPQPSTTPDLEVVHLKRLSQVVLLSSVLVLLSTRIQLELSFFWALALALFLLIGLGQAFRFLRRQSD